ncbi:hypothetical protein Y032_0003g1651 [Ancylostoma ceylanicum]|uniref:Uncharacterized protein n=1 Tax=Ancylostoma ceylanicum TaxID=53326 RepID=A0A016VYW3_9BILA|nr:hypothetical protein Y032_0003g1651 [Ancylostoma ceylanicum]
MLLFRTTTEEWEYGSLEHISRKHSEKESTANDPLGPAPQRADWLVIRHRPPRSRTAAVRSHKSVQDLIKAVTTQP